MGQQALLVWVPKDTVMSSSIIHNRVCIVLCLVCAQFIGMSGVQAQPRGPIVDRAQPLRSCEHPDERLSGQVVLQAGCFYEQSFEIDEPDTTLDCNGAELRPEDGFAVNIKRNADRAVVRNCYVRGVKGIAVRVRKVRDGESDDEVRALAPQDVLIENVDITSTDSVGVHLLPHTVGVTVRNSVLSNNSSSGVYMSPYGRRHRIINNQIENNGHIKPDGTLGSVGIAERELPSTPLPSITSLATISAPTRLVASCSTRTAGNTRTMSPIADRADPHVPT